MHVGKQFEIVNAHQQHTSNLPSGHVSEVVPVDGRRRYQTLAGASFQLQNVAKSKTLASETLSAVQFTHAESEAKSAALASDRARLENAIQQPFALAQARDASASDGEALSALTLELDLEEVLRSALPKTFTEPLHERHIFDALVLKEFEQVLQEHTCCFVFMAWRLVGMGGRV